MTARLDGVRSIMEALILDDHKWAKVPGIAADAFMVDLEDSAPPALKGEARKRAVRAVTDQGYFEGRLVIPRVNNLDSPWGYNDLVAMADAGAEILAYPKTRSAGELELVRAILRDHGADPELVVAIESASAIARVNEIAAFPTVVGFLLGPSDFALDVGFELYDETSGMSPAVDHMRSAAVFAAQVHGTRVFDAAFVADIRDLDGLRSYCRRSKSFGTNGMLTFYPPHIDVINEEFSVSEEDIRRSEAIVAAYEEGLAQGRAAVILDGQTLIVQDYKRAISMLSRTPSPRRPNA